MSRNAFLNSRSEEKTFSLTFIPGKNKSKCGLSWSVLLSTMGTLFPNNVFLLLQHVERVCKSFRKESLTRTSSHLHNAACALSIGQFRIVQQQKNRVEVQGNN